MADATPEVAADAVTPAQLEALETDLRREMVNFRTVEAEPANPLARFRSTGELSLALLNGDQDEAKTLQRALVDQITTNNPGVMRPKYVNDIKTIVDFARPTVTAFGTDSVMEGQGNTIEWPTFTGDLAAIVAAQATEKTAVNSVRIDIGTDSASLATYAAASDISLQLIRRSTPSYITAHNDIMSRSYATVTNIAAGAEIVAGGTASAGVWVPATGTAPELRAALFQASLEVETATGNPASFALCASDVYTAIGTLDGLYPEPYGTQNVAGTADARSLNVNVSGLPIIHDRGLAAGTFIVSNSTTASFHEDGPMFVSALNVELLGNDVGIWGMGVTTVYNGEGVRLIGAV